MISPIFKNICMMILLIIFIFLLSNDTSWNTFFQKKESIKYILIFFFIYLAYYQFNISLLILPLLSLHFMSQPSFRQKIVENPIWQNIKEKVLMFMDNRVVEQNLKEEVIPKVIEEKREEEIISQEYPEIVEIHDDAGATQFKREDNDSSPSETKSTELSFEELEELYTSLNRQLEELNK